MVTGAAFDDAVAIARSRPSLAVGLHLVLVCGRGALAPSEIPTLVDGAGNFPLSPVHAGLRYQFSARARGELRREIREQFRRFRATGLTLSHVDGHLHLHLHPIVMRMLAELSRDEAIPVVRLPFEELSTAWAIDRSAWITKLGWAAIFGRLRRFGEKKLAAAGVGYADRVYGLFHTGRIDERYLLALLPRIAAKRVEIYAHPAHELPGEPRNGPPGAGPAELAALVSPRVKAAMQAGGYVPATFAAFPQDPAPARTSPGARSR